MVESPSPTSVSSSTTASGAAPEIAYITIEYCVDDLFSGNGVCARSHVRGLSALGIRQHVIIGRPLAPDGRSPPPPPRLDDTPKGVTLHACPLRVWRTTDRESDHAAFAAASARVLERLQRDGVQLHAVLAVDWTGAAGVHAMTDSARARLIHSTPVFFLNFRVYSRMTNIPDADRDFYHAAESDAVELAVKSGGGIMGLCDADDAALRDMLRESPLIHTNTASAAFRVILPMLRDEFAQIALTNRDIILDTSRRRRYFVCLVRLSEDKGPQRFVDVCEAMTHLHPQIWDRLGIVPLMAGAASQPTFASQLKERFTKNVPGSVVVDDFLNAQQLSQILFDAALNMHPARYEAFGMTIVEAGSCGVPTILNSDGIGAAQLLNPANEAAIAVDIADTYAVAKKVIQLLEQPHGQLAEIGRNAYTAATSWTERPHVDALWDLVETCIATRAHAVTQLE